MRKKYKKEKQRKNLTEQFKVVRDSFLSTLSNANERNLIKQILDTAYLDENDQLYGQYSKMYEINAMQEKTHLIAILEGFPYFVDALKSYQSADGNISGLILFNDIWVKKKMPLLSSETIAGTLGWDGFSEKN